MTVTGSKKILDILATDSPYLWINPLLNTPSDLSLTMTDISDAEKRLENFAPLLAILFPELKSSGGICPSSNKMG